MFKYRSLSDSKTLLWSAVFVLNAALAGAANAQSSSGPQAKFNLMSSWGNDNFCGSIEVTTPVAISDWRVLATFDGAIDNIWNGTYSAVDEDGYNAVFEPSAGAGTISAGSTASMGFCGRGSTPVIHELEWEGSGQPDGSLVELAKGSYMIPLYRDKEYIVANTAADVERINEDLSSAVSADLSQYTVIAAFMGDTPHGGFEVTVLGVTEKEDSIDVHVEFVEPQRCWVTYRKMQPFHIVAVPKTSKPFNFLENTRYNVCNDY